jgi:hypothetical protein
LEVISHDTSDGGNLIGVLAKAFLLLARNPEPQPRGSPFYEKDFASARPAMSTMWGHVLVQYSDFLAKLMVVSFANNVKLVEFPMDLE